MRLQVGAAEAAFAAQALAQQRERMDAYRAFDIPLDDALPPEYEQQREKYAITR